MIIVRTYYLSFITFEKECIETRTYRWRWWARICAFGYYADLFGVSWSVIEEPRDNVIPFRRRT